MSAVAARNDFEYCRKNRNVVAQGRILDFPLVEYRGVLELLSAAASDLLIFRNALADPIVVVNWEAIDKPHLDLPGV